MAKKKKQKKTKKEASSSLLAVVRVRGGINTDTSVKKTFQSLNLYNKNWCVVVEETDTIKGMLRRVKDFITWGEISKETLEDMAKQRGETAKDDDKYVTVSGKKYRKYFRLSPPRKGFGRAGIKKTFKENGALGYRADKINDLLERMI